MKALPLLFKDGAWVEGVAPELATHLRFKLPGPAGTMTLPVMIKGTREGTGNWTWNGDVEKPTLKPSVLIRAGHFAPGFDSKKDTCWCEYWKQHPENDNPVFHCYRCHTWINDGVAQFLGDCTHELVNQTAALLDL